MSNRFLVAVDDAMRIWNSFLFDQSPCARLAEFAATTGSLTSEMAPRAGFEPATNRLTAGCSTAELPRTTTWRRCLSCLFGDGQTKVSCRKRLEYQEARRKRGRVLARPQGVG